MISWTPYLGTPVDRARRRPRVTLSRYKRLTMNQAAWEALGRPEAVRFFYDPENKRIGVAGVSPESNFAFMVHQRKQFTYRYVHTGSFCNHFGIHPKATIAFNDVSIDRDGIMSLDLATAAHTTYVRR
jgi:hypothetical protein